MTLFTPTYTNITPTLHQLYTFFILGLHLSYTFSTPNLVIILELHLTYTFSTPNSVRILEIHLTYTFLNLTLHLYYTNLHLHYTNLKPILHLFFSCTTPNLHFFYTQFNNNSWTTCVTSVLPMCAGGREGGPNFVFRALRPPVSEIELNAPCLILIQIFLPDPH